MDVIDIVGKEACRILDVYEKPTKKFFEEIEAEEGHGIEHSKEVMNHCVRAIIVGQPRLPPNIIYAILLAAYLHDVDDHKLSPDSRDYENARQLMSREPPQTSVLVVEMIKLVSCSTNGNHVDDELPAWMYYPRYADRLESLGVGGIKRCIEYGKYIKRKVFDKNTKRATCMKELNEIAPVSLFHDYVKSNGHGCGSTTMDHFYIKLIHLHVKTGNKYFDAQMDERITPIHNFLFHFGKTGEIKY